jgi:phosphotransferase system  glucose/maltose/N-acetylglucosamine-specific IIC component
MISDNRLMRAVMVIVAVLVVAGLILGTLRFGI